MDFSTILSIISLVLVTCSFILGVKNIKGRDKEIDELNKEIEELKKKLEERRK